MIAYKIMRARHYKPGQAFLTAKVNYGKRMLTDKHTAELIRLALAVTEEFGLGFGQVVQMCLDFQSRRLPPRIPSKLPGAKARELMALSHLAKNVLDDAFSATFWETLYEQVRSAERPNCPTRLNSYFACKDIDSLSRYRDTHWSDRMNDKMACQVDIQGCSVRFEADMVILDRITEDMNYEAARPYILRYWDQEVSDQPIIELLLQGSIVLSDRVRLDGSIPGNA